MPCLLSLPFEIRLQIYLYLFDDTTLTFEAPFVGPRLPSPKPQDQLAILRTCHAIHAEIHSLWLSRCTFEFANTERFLDILHPLPTETRRLLRHATVMRVHPVCIRASISQMDYWDLSDVLSLLPGLQLDRLCLGDCWHNAETRDQHARRSFGAESNTDIRAYKLVEKLLKYSLGWKEMRFSSPSGRMYAWQSKDNGLNGDLYKRFAQPDQWRDILDERDGKENGATVDVYCSSIQNSDACWLHPVAHGEQSDTPWVRKLQTSRHGDEMQDLDEACEWDAPSAMIAKRGLNTNYIEDGRNMTRRQKRLQGMSWHVIREQFWDYRHGMRELCPVEHWERHGLCLTSMTNPPTKWID